MNIKVLAFAMTMSITATAQTPKLSKNNIDEVLHAMTLEEKASLLIGGEYDFWSTTAVAGNSSRTVPGAAGSGRERAAPRGPGRPRRSGRSRSARRRRRRTVPSPGAGGPRSTPYEG